MDRLTKHIALKFRSARRAKGLTQEDLAGRLEMATESVSHIERGVTVPSLKTLAAAAEIMGIDIAELFAGLGDKRQVTAKRAELEGLLQRLGRDLDDQRLAFVVELADGVAKLR